MIGCVDDMAGLADNLRIGKLRDTKIFIRIVELRQEVTHAIQARAFLVIGFKDCPRCVGGVGVKEHGFFSLGVILPLVETGAINR